MSDGESGLVSHLELIGLTREEAAVYLHIVIAGPTKAGELAKALTLSRADAYRTLHALVDRGALVAEVGYPTLYRAVDVAVLFETALEEEARRVETMTRAREDAARLLARARELDADRPKSHAWRLVQGRIEGQAQIARMLHAARREVRAITTHRAAIPLARQLGTLDIGLERASTGVRVRLIVSADGDGHREFAAAVEDHPIEVRVLDVDGLVGSIAVDDASVLTSVAIDPSDRRDAAGDVAFWTDAPDFIRSYAVFFESAWRLATPVPRARVETMATT